MSACYLTETREIGRRQWLTTQTPLRFIPLQELHRGSPMFAAEAVPAVVTKPPVAGTDSLQVRG